MTPEEKFQLVRSVGEECIQEDELRNLLAKKPNPICYDGFEPSGRMHIAQVLFEASFFCASVYIIFCLLSFFKSVMDELLAVVSCQC